MLPAGASEADADADSDDPMVLWLDEWDEGAPWLPWAAHDDPVGVPCVLNSYRRPDQAISGFERGAGQC